MANRNHYTYTPGYAGSGKGYVPPGNRAPKPRGAQPQAMRQPPPRAPKVAVKTPPRPLKDLLMFCMVLFVAPLIGIIGILAKPVLWVFVIVSALCVLLIFLLRCFTISTRAVISVGLLLFSILGLVAAIDPAAPGQQQSYASLSEPAAIATQTLFPETTAASTNPPGMFPAYVAAETSPTPPIDLAEGADAGQNQTGDDTGIFPGLQTQAQTDALDTGAQTDASGGESDAVVPTNQAVTEAQQALENYLLAWTTSDWEEMLKYCQRSWINQQDSATRSLYFNHNYWYLNSWAITPEATAPSADSATFTVICDLTLSSASGKNTKKRYDAIVFKDSSGAWYVDPSSMRTGVDVAETLSPAMEQAAQPTPEPEPTIPPDLTLWYNEKGGEFYHLDEKCSSINASNYKYMKTFTYSELSDTKYKNLKTCAECDAPSRP